MGKGLHNNTFYVCAEKLVEICINGDDLSANRHFSSIFDTTANEIKKIFFSRKNHKLHIYRSNGIWKNPYSIVWNELVILFTKLISEETKYELSTLDWKSYTVDSKLRAPWDYPGQAVVRQSSLSPSNANSAHQRVNCYTKRHSAHTKQKEDMKKHMHKTGIQSNIPRKTKQVRLINCSLKSFTTNSTMYNQISIEKILPINSNKQTKNGVDFVPWKQNSFEILK